MTSAATGESRVAAVVADDTIKLATNERARRISRRSRPCWWSQACASAEAAAAAAAAAALCLIALTELNVSPTQSAPMHCLTIDGHLSLYGEHWTAVVLRSRSAILALLPLRRLLDRPSLICWRCQCQALTFHSVTYVDIHTIQRIDSGNVNPGMLRHSDTTVGKIIGPKIFTVYLVLCIYFTQCLMSAFSTSSYYRFHMCFV